MKYLIPILLALLCSPSLIAAPGGSHHKVTAYDYHDYLNSEIQSKTFIRYLDGVAYDIEWSFDRSIPGEVARTDIVTDPEGNVIRYTTITFIPTAESFDQVKTEWYDPSGMPPEPYDRTDYNPPLVKLTNAMIPGIAWGSAGVMNSTWSGQSYYLDKLEVLAVEDVSVTAGAFEDCLKIHSVHQYRGNTAHSQMDWYCPEMGLVKRIHNGRELFDLVSVTYNE